MPKQSPLASKIRASQGTKTDVRGPALSPRFVAFLVALLLLAGLVSVLEGTNRQAAWALVGLLLVGVLVADAGKTLVGAAQLLSRLRLR